MGFISRFRTFGKTVVLGSYPITPATDILVELARHKSLNARVMQCEDEIAGICSSIGASYAGSMAVTSTSGPGLSLKSEAIGLAVMTELPLVIINVQRGGLQQGCLPSRNKQIYCKHCMVVMVPALHCYSRIFAQRLFEMAYNTAKLSLEHMTPAILMTDGYIGQGTELFRIPKVADMPHYATSC